jgi:uncharacterized protein (TIGR02145 family)
MNKLLAITQLALCFVFVFCNNGDGQTRPSELVGTWVHEDEDEDASVLIELFKDGTGVVYRNISLFGGGVVDDNISISWKIENKRFVILSPRFTLSCNYKVSGYELALAYDNGVSTIYVKKGKVEEYKAQKIADAKKMAEKAKASVTRFKDSRDGKVYKVVKIGSQTWFSENLNYAAEGSKCYENNAENCEKYGRLYNWSSAKTACPAGWHLPSDDEWTTFTDNVGGEDIAGKKLNSTAGWNENGNGTNDYAFSALPGGGGNSGGSFGDVGGIGFWWSSTTKTNAESAWNRDMVCIFERVGRDNDDKAFLFSVRCVQD